MASASDPVGAIGLMGAMGAMGATGLVELKVRAQRGGGPSQDRDPQLGPWARIARIALARFGVS